MNTLAARPSVALAWVALTCFTLAAETEMAMLSLMYLAVSWFAES